MKTIPSVLTLSIGAMCIGFLVCSFGPTSYSGAEEWGFFGHKRLNRLAVFTLPQDMLPLYKQRIEYLTEHAVDPDKRRYATRHEAVRHYIDLDQWGAFPYDHIPRQFENALAKFSEIAGVNTSGDTIRASWKMGQSGLRLATSHKGLSKLRFSDFESYFSEHIKPNYYDGPIFLANELNRFFGDAKFVHVFVIDQFSEHGTLPYNLIAYQEKLTKAFTAWDWDRAMKLSADIGHYIGDAHVPLHTTSNYNGQLTDQVGIHAFWESRIPELMADQEYDYFVGNAELIEDIESYYWNIVLESHALVDSVLMIEKRLSRTFPEDQQYCFVDRNSRNVSLPCEAYSRAYAEAMDGMVEDRFRASIRAIGDAWYTAWYHAGKPDLSLPTKVLDLGSQDTVLSQSQSIFGRQHWD